MRQRAKVDANQPQIVRELRQIGASVAITSQMGHGFPDLSVGWRGQNYYFEVKDGNQPPSRRRLTPDEQEWHNLWHGQVHVIESTADALKVMEQPK